MFYKTRILQQIYLKKKRLKYFWSNILITLQLFSGFNSCFGLLKKKMAMQLERKCNGRCNILTRFVNIIKRKKKNS